MADIIIRTSTLKSILEESLDAIELILEKKKKSRLEYFSIQYQRRWTFRLFGGLITPEIIEKFYNCKWVDELFNPWQWYSMEDGIYHVEEQHHKLSNLLLICMHPAAEVMSLSSEEFYSILRYINAG